jgi:hypothetical protein
MLDIHHLIDPSVNDIDQTKLACHPCNCKEKHSINQSGLDMSVCENGDASRVRDDDRGENEKSVVLQRCWLPYLQYMISLGKNSVRMVCDGFRNYVFRNTGFNWGSKVTARRYLDECADWFDCFTGEKEFKVVIDQRSGDKMVVYANDAVRQKYDPFWKEKKRISICEALNES